MQELSLLLKLGLDQWINEISWCLFLHFAGLSIKCFFDAFKNFIVVSERSNGLTQINVLKNGETKPIELAKPNFKLGGYVTKTKPVIEIEEIILTPKEPK